MSLSLQSLQGAGALVFGGVVCVACAFGLLGGFKRFGRRPARFGRKPLLTDNEQEFFQRLKEAARAARLEVYPQVAMGALMVAKGKQSRFAFAQKIVDFVLVDDKGKVLALIELDDRMHDRKRDRARDAMTKEAGYKTLRYESRSRPSVDGLVSDFKGLLSPWKR